MPLHTRRCGALVDARGQHGLVYKQAPSRIARHQQPNDLVTRALVLAGIPATKEPVGLTRRDGINARMGRHKFHGARRSCWYMGRHSCEHPGRLMSLPQPVDVERWPNSLLLGNAINTPTSLQHTLPFNCYGDLGLNERLCIPFLRRPWPQDK